MHKSRRVKITDINPHLTCVLCSGYLIDATTIIECLHSFCRSCIVKYLESNKYCPICDVQVHKTKPLLNIRSDQTLQDIVYKLVPGLFQNEMCRRKDFYAKHPDQKPPSPEECGEVTQYSHIYTADESISLSLEYYNNNISYDNDNNTTAPETKLQAHPSRRFLRCPAAVSVSHLQKLIRAKYGLSNEHRVDILYMNDRLSEDFTLMDIAYIYLWRRKGPLHLTYRIFEVAKRIKLNENPNENVIKTETIKEEEVQNEWKEVQLQISENGIMSVTNIGETIPPETVTSNLVEVKTEINLLKTDLPELSPIQKVEKPSLEEKPVEEVKKEVENQEKPVVKLGKHKLQETNDESSAKMMKPNLPPITPLKITAPVKNVQQLSRNHPLKIHSQTITKNHINPPPTAKTVPQKIQIHSLNTQNQMTKSINNNNTAPKVVVSSVQKDQISAPTTVQNTPNLVTPKTTIQTEKSVKTSVSLTTTTNSIVSSVSSSMHTNLIMPNSPKYTQAGQSSNNTTTTKSDDVNNLLQKTPISSSSAAIPINNCIQSSKVSIVPKKSPVKTGSYKTLRDPPKAWNPQIPRQNLTKPIVYPPNNGASTSDVNKIDNRTVTKPAKFFKMRNNVPRYLGNPASGVKPMYQVREGDKSPPEVKKSLEIKKPVVENKLNNNNKDDVKTTKTETPTETPKKIEIKKQSIIKVDPRTLKPITQEVSNPSCSDKTPEMKINQSTVPIFNPLRTQKSQTSPKIDRRSPKTSFLDIQNPPKSPMDRSSPKSTSGKSLNSPTSKKDKLSLNFTPPNPFIPNLTSPNLAPNQFLYPNFASYDPRVMNNLTAYHPFSMYYSQPRLNYPGLSTQNLPLSPNLMSSLNLEVNKNLRKNYEMSMMQLSPTMDIKKPSTCVKSPRENYPEEKVNLNNEKQEKSVSKNNLTNKNVKSEKANLPNIESKQETKNNSNVKEEKTKTVETNEQKPKPVPEAESKPKIEAKENEKKVENTIKEPVQENVDKTKGCKETNQVEKSKEVVQKPEENKTEVEKPKEVKST